MVFDINGGPDASNPSNFHSLNNTLLFTAYTPTSNTELWATDGTINTSPTLIDIEPSNNISSYPKDFLYYNGNIYFNATTFAGPGSQVFVTAGTALSTQPISPNVTIPSSLTTSQGKIFFSGYDPTNYMELWSTDGSTSNTLMVKDIYTGHNSSEPHALVDYNGTLIFAAESLNNGEDLWVSDGTTAGTNLVFNFSYNDPAIEKGIVYKGRVYFYAGNSFTKHDLWVTDGTSNGTHVFKDFYPNTNGDALVRNYVIVDSLLFFIANDGTNGDELWYTNGSQAGTKKIVPSLGAHYNPLGSTDTFYVINHTLYFNATYDNKGDELYKLDVSTISTDVAQISEDSKISIYPNPTGNFLNIENADGASFAIYSMDDKVIKNGVLTNTSQVNVSNLAVGYYVMHLQSDKLNC